MEGTKCKICQWFIFKKWVWQKTRLFPGFFSDPFPKPVRVASIQWSGQAAGTSICWETRAALAKVQNRRVARVGNNILLR